MRAVPRQVTLRPSRPIEIGGRRAHAPDSRPTRSDPAVKGAHEVVGLYGDPDTSWGIAVDLGVRRHRTRGRWRAAGRAVRRPRPPRRGAHRGGGGRGGVVGAAGRAGHRRLRGAARCSGWRCARTDGGWPSAPTTEPSTGSAWWRWPASALGAAAAQPAPGGSATGPRGPASCAPACIGWARHWSTRRHGSPAAASRATARGSQRAHPTAGRARDGAPGRRGRATCSATGGTRVARCSSSARPGAPGTLPEADRQTAYLRLRVPVGCDAEQVRRALAAVDPEPDFPATSARGLGPRVTHLMRRRLGATALLSNLGRDRGARRLDRDVPRVQRSASRGDRAGVHVEHDDAEPADPPGRVHGRRARPAARRPRGRLLRLTRRLGGRLEIRGQYGSYGESCPSSRATGRSRSRSRIFRPTLRSHHGQLAHDPEPVGGARPASSGTAPSSRCGVRR